jgi:hypothetical protein
VTGPSSHPRPSKLRDRPALSPLGRRLRDTVDAFPRSRVPLEALRATAADADVSTVADVRARGRLASAIAELAEAGIVKLPVAPRLWDRLADPPLPTWVQRPPIPRPAAPEARPTVWHAELAWVATLERAGRLSDGDFDLLSAVNAFLARGGPTVDVPLRERSLELLGDEKALDGWRRHRLFGGGRLSLTLLGCYVTHPPVEYHEIDAAPAAPWLIVENWTTYDSIVRSQPVGVARVVFGGGRQLDTRLAAIADADPQPSALVYYGDIDPAGLSIPLAAGRRAIDLGLPPLQPAAGLYRYLLDVGRRRRTRGRPDAALAHQVPGWLGEQLGADVLAVMHAGHRVPQEGTGIAQLPAFDWATLTEPAPGATE